MKHATVEHEKVQGQVLVSCPFLRFFFYLCADRDENGYMHLSTLAIVITPPFRCDFLEQAPITTFQVRSQTPQQF